MGIYEAQIRKRTVSKGIALWEALLVFSVNLLIYTSLILPTGSIYGFNIKIALVLLVCIFIGVDLFFKKKNNRAIYSLFIWFGVIVLFILWGWLIAATNRITPSSSVSQSFVILSTFVLVLLPAYLVAGKIIAPLNLLNTVMKIAFVYALIKIAMALLIMLNIVSATELFRTIENMFGYKGVTMSTNSFLRLNFPSDYIFPIAVFISLTFSLRSKKRFSRYWIAFGLFIVALILTYSRYLWVYGLTSIFIAFSLYFSLKWTKKKIYLLLGLVAIVIIIIALIGLEYGPAIFDYVSERYSGGGAQYSDSIRSSISYSLSGMALEKPIFGWGLGAYSLNFTRFPDTPWLYELQWLSFFMQFGLLGVGFVLVLLLWYINFVFRSGNKVILGSGILFFVFLSVGFFNCFLLTSSAGVVYLFYFLISITDWKNALTSHKELM